MIGLDRKRTTKANSKVRIFCLFLAVLFILSQVKNIEIVSAAEKIYVDKTMGVNTNSGKSPKLAVQSLRKARELIKDEGTIYVRIEDEWIELSAKQLKKDTEEDKSEKGLAVTEEASKEEPVVKATTKEAVEEDKPVAEVVPEPTSEVASTSEPEVATEPVSEDVSEEEPEVASEVEAEAKAEPEPEVTPEVIAEETSEAPDKADISEDETTEADVVTSDDDSEDSIKEDTAEEEDAEDSQEDIPAASEVVPEVVEDEMPVDEDDNSQEEEDVPEEVDVQIESLARLVGQTTVMVEGTSDVDSVAHATEAYEALDEEAKSNVPVSVYKRLRAAQIVVASEGMRTVSSPVEIVGNTGDIYEQSGTQSSNDGSSSNKGTSSNDSTASSSTSSDSSNTTQSTNSTNSSNSADSKSSTVATRSTDVKTGDTNMILMMAGICLLAVAVIGGMILLKKKKK